MCGLLVRRDKVMGLFHLHRVVHYSCGYFSYCFVRVVLAPVCPTLVNKTVSVCVRV